MSSKETLESSLSMSTVGTMEKFFGPPLSIVGRPDQVGCSNDPVHQIRQRLVDRFYRRLGDLEDAEALAQETLLIVASESGLQPDNIVGSMVRNSPTAKPLFADSILAIAADPEKLVIRMESWCQLVVSLDKILQGFGNRRRVLLKARHGDYGQNVDRQKGWVFFRHKTKELGLTDGNARVILNRTLDKILKGLVKKGLFSANIDSPTMSELKQSLGKVAGRILERGKQEVIYDIPFLLNFLKSVIPSRIKEVNIGGSALASQRLAGF